MFFKEVGKEHIEECFYMYTRLQAGQKFMYMVTYDRLVKHEEEEVKQLSKVMGIELSIEVCFTLT